MKTICCESLPSSCIRSPWWILTEVIIVPKNEMFTSNSIYAPNFDGDFEFILCGQFCDNYSQSRVTSANIHLSMRTQTNSLSSPDQANPQIRAQNKILTQNA